MLWNMEQPTKAGCIFVLILLKNMICSVILLSFFILVSLRENELGQIP